MDQTIPHPELFSAPFDTDQFHGMPYRPLGRSGLRVSNVGLGLWKVGLPESGDAARVNEQAAFPIFDRAIELGVTFWDTANRYNFGSGNSERVIGRWLKRNPEERRNVVLATKMGGGMDGFTPNHCRLSRQNIIDATRACLDRLQLETIDLLYFHIPDSMTPPEESLAAIEDLVTRGWIRYFAVSNFTVDQLAIYQAIERTASVRCRVLAVQNQFDILRGEKAAHAGMLAYAARTGVSFVAHSPLAQGLVTNRYLDPKKVGPGDRLHDEKGLDLLSDAALMAKLRALADLAREFGLEVSQLALAYMLTLPGMGPVIPSATTLKQLESNAAVGKIKLTEEQKAKLKAVVGI